MYIFLILFILIFSYYLFHYPHYFRNKKGDKMFFNKKSLFTLKKILFRSVEYFIYIEMALLVILVFYYPVKTSSKDVFTHEKYHLKMQDKVPNKTFYMAYSKGSKPVLFFFSKEKGMQELDINNTSLTISYVIQEPCVDISYIQRITTYEYKNKYWEFIFKDLYLDKLNKYKLGKETIEKKDISIWASIPDTKIYEEDINQFK